MPLHSVNRHILLFVLSLVAVTFAPAAIPAADISKLPTLEIQYDGRTIEGAAVSWNAKQANLLGRDGRLWQVQPDKVAAFRQVSTGFRPYSPSEFRAALLRELGDGYEVTGTSHYLIAHPRGQRDKWAERFENLYRSFSHFFAVRGMELSPPAFPLVGIVRKDRREFVEQAASHGAAASGVVGYYDLLSNRLTIYDMGGDSARWQQNAAVLIHEATHQSAFNTGIHCRYQRPPLWVAEGLATLFEAPGIYDARNYPEQSDRINRERLAAFRRMNAPQHRPELLREMIASDRLFETHPLAAYAEAWALTFLLAETEPQKYVAYLKRIATRSSEAYPAAARLADFTAIFGNDWRMLEARLLRQMNALEMPTGTASNGHR